MTYIYEELDERGYTRHFQTLAGATSHGCRRRKSHGYTAVREVIWADKPYRAIVHAVWKDRGVVVARVLS